MSTHSVLPGSKPFLIAIVLVALALRVAYLLLLDRAIDAADSIHYIAMAQTFRAGDFVNFDENLPPLLSLLAAGAHVVVADWERAFRAVTLLASSLTVVPVYQLGRTLHTETSGRMAAALVACWPWLIDYATRIQPEALAVFLWFASAWSVYRAVTEGGANLLFAPALLFALHLARPEGTLLMLAAPCGALLFCERSDTARFRRALMLALTVVFLAVLYALAMRAIIGSAMLSYRAPVSGDIDNYLRRGAIEGVRTFYQLGFNVLPIMMGPLLLAFFGIGLYRWRDQPRIVTGLGGFIALFCGVQFLAAVLNFSPAPRYMMPIVIAASLWSAAGIVHATAALKDANRRRLAMLPSMLVFGFFAIQFAYDVSAEHLGGIPRTPKEYRAAGEWMQRELEPGLVICRKPQIGFYAGMPTIGPAADATPQDLIDTAVETGARYVVIDERYTVALAPGLKSLLDPSNAPDGLAVLRDDLSAWPGARIVIYEVRVAGIEYLAPEAFPRPNSHMGPDRRRRSAEAENGA